MKIKNIIDRIEKSNISFPLYLVTFFAIVLSRNFLEGVFENGHAIGIPGDLKFSVYNFFCHYTLSWAFALTALLVLFRALIREDFKRISNVVLFFFLLINIVPLLDFAFYGGNKSVLYINNLKDLINTLLFLFIFPAKINSTLGIKIEVFLAVIFALIYAYVKTKSKIKCFIAAFGVYFISIAGLATPMLVFLPFYLFKPSFKVDRLITDFFDAPPNAFHFMATRYSIIIVFILVLLLLILFLLYKRQKFIFFIRTIRYSRHIYYTVIYVCGFAFGLRMLENNNNFFNSLFDYAYFLAGILLANLLFLACLMMNNLHDKKIDLYNKKPNPLNADKTIGKSTEKNDKILTQQEYLNIFWIILLLALFLAFSISLPVFILSLFICVIGFVYSCPPYRFKNVFIVNTFLIALSSLLWIFLGFTTMTLSSAPELFPINLSALILLVLTLAFNVKDINDYSGDKIGGVKTFMTVFGEKWGRVIISGLAFAGYLLVPVLLFSQLLFLPALCCGIATLILINSAKGKINEFLIFCAFFVFLAFFIYYNPLHL